MTAVSATEARKDIYNLIRRVNEDCKPVHITTTKGKGAVLIGEDDWASIEETLYLESVPGMAQSLHEAAAEPIEECLSEAEVEW